MNNRNENISPAIVKFQSSDRRHGNIAVQFGTAATTAQAQEFVAAYYGHDVSPQQVQRDFDIITNFDPRGVEQHEAGASIGMVDERGKRESALIGTGGQSPAQAIYRMAGRIILQRQINAARS